MPPTSRQLEGSQFLTRTDIRQARVTLGKLLGTGGSAVVYEIQERPELVAKLYVSRSNPDSLDGAFAYGQQLRIEAMLSAPPALDEPIMANGEPFPQLAWPVSHLLQTSGDPVGFVMRHLPMSQARDLEALLTPTGRRMEGFPEAYYLRVMVAANLAAILRELHKSQHYVVDLKPKNIKVCNDQKGLGLVALLDTDGFSVLNSRNGMRFPAQLVSGEYTAPELFQSGQGPSTAGEYQDRWALAVIIFRLLNENIHPYQGIYTGSGENSIDEHVKHHRYAYSRSSRSDQRPSPFSIHEFFEDDTRNLFERAFGPTPSMRPDAREWRDHLARFTPEGNPYLRRCIVNSNHWHFSKGCGLCWRDGPVQSHGPVQTAVPPGAISPTGAGLGAQVGTSAPSSGGPSGAQAPATREKQRSWAGHIAWFIAALILGYGMIEGGKQKPHLTTDPVPDSSPVPSPGPVATPTPTKAPDPSDPLAYVAQAMAPALQSVLAAARDAERDDEAIRAEIDKVMSQALASIEFLSSSIDPRWKAAHDQAAQAARAGHTDQAIALEGRAFAMNQSPLVVAADLAYHLSNRDSSADERAEAYQLAIFALYLQWKTGQRGRPLDWQNLAIASGLLGHSDEASNALLVSLAVLIAANDSRVRTLRCANAAAQFLGPQREQLQPALMGLLRRYKVRYGFQSLTNCALPTDVLQAVERWQPEAPGNAIPAPSPDTPTALPSAEPTPSSAPTGISNAMPTRVAPTSDSPTPTHVAPTQGDFGSPPSAGGVTLSAPEVMDRMRARVGAEIRMPAGTPPGARVKVRVTLLDSGAISKLDLVSPSGAFSFDQEVMRAIHAAQPFPMPSDPGILDQVRVLELTFANSAAALSPTPASTPTPAPTPIQPPSATPTAVRPIPTARPSRATTTPSPSPTESKASTPSPTPGASPDNAAAEAAYRDALKVIQHSDSTHAIDELLSLQQRYPGTSIDKDITYWLGISYTKAAQRDKALAQFDKLIKQYPDSTFVPQAYLRLANVQKLTGDPGSARDTLRDLISKYPNSPEAAKGRQELARLPPEPTR